MNARLFTLFFLFVSVSLPALSQLNTTLFSGSIGQTAIDIGKVVRYDSNGNILVAGRFGNQPDFDLGPNVFNIQEWSAYDIFVAKYSPAGALIWAKGFTGPSGSQKEIADLIIDANNHLYLTGKFSGTMDFDPDLGQDLRTSNVSWNTFLIKMDATGTVLWGHDFGSAASGNEGIALDFDSQGNLLWTGYYAGTIDFDPSPATAQHTAPSGKDIFIAKFSPSGAYIWLQTISAFASSEVVVNIHVTTANEIFIVGSETNQIDFDPSANTATIFDIYGSSGGTYVAKYTATGDFLWVKRYGQAPNTCIPNDSYLDKNTGRLYLSGYFQNVMDADPNPNNVVTVTGDPNTFSGYLLKLDSNGDLTWHYSLLATTRAEGRGLAIFQNQDVLWTGEFWGTTDFDNTTNTINATTVGPRDVFALHINNAGAYVNHGIIGGSQNDFMGGVAINSSDQAVLTGSYIATADLDPTDSVANYTASGNSDCFLVSVGQCVVSYGALTDQACSSYTSPSGNATYTQSGIYYDTLVNTAGCDSIVQINLTIGTNTNTAVSQQSCSATYTPSGNQLMNATGVYVDSLVSQLGCDSLITIDFTLLPTSYNTITLTSCVPMLAPSGNFMMNATGSYTDSLLNYLDCDSIETIIFTLTPLQFTVDQNTDSLWVSNSTATSYQWIDCSTNTPISNASNASFVPQSSGDYAVIADNGVCSDTSNCFPFTSQGGLGMPNIAALIIGIYPNPASQAVTILLNEPSALQIFSYDGKLMATLAGASTYHLNVTEWRNGLYYVLDDSGAAYRFIKQ